MQATPFLMRAFLLAKRRLDIWHALSTVRGDLLQMTCSNNIMNHTIYSQKAFSSPAPAWMLCFNFPGTWIGFSTVYWRREGFFPSSSANMSFHPVLYRSTCLKNATWLNIWLHYCKLPSPASSPSAPRDSFPPFAEISLQCIHSA